MGITPSSGDDKLAGQYYLLASHQRAV